MIDRSGCQRLNVSAHSPANQLAHQARKAVSTSGAPYNHTTWLEGSKEAK